MDKQGALPMPEKILTEGDHTTVKDVKNHFKLLDKLIKRHLKGKFTPTDNRQLVNELRRKEDTEMKKLNFRTRKAYKKFMKRLRSPKFKKECQAK